MLGQIRLATLWAHAMNLSPALVPSRLAGADRGSPLPAPAGAFLNALVEEGLIDGRDRESFIAERIDRLRDYTTEEKIGHALIQDGLLNAYQLEQLLSGSWRRLVLGNYRVLQELGKGGMGVVYLAEHRLMKRRVAVKVLPTDDDCPPAIRHRFLAEMRVLAELSHPNVVLALDAGELSDREHATILLYLVTELIEGGDLEKHVTQHGLCSVDRACDWIRQAAAGLQAAHDQHLVHRDLKPSNLLLSSTGQVKLVDFGLVRQFSSRLTDPRALLGSLEFMPPEQSHDPSAVGKEADIYSLGATLFWLLTGEGPYPYRSSTAQTIRMLQEEEPRRLRMLRADVPPALDELVAQMLERNPARRPRSPMAVMNALHPFVRPKRTVECCDNKELNAAALAEQLVQLNETLEKSLSARDADLRDAHNALLFTIARIAESRDGETPTHLKRMQAYTRALAVEAAKLPPWQGLIDERFLEQLDRCVPLHDIGKLGLPDDILLKPASLSRGERERVETHPLIGDRLLEALAKEHGSALDFLGMARCIVRSHHERWDGKGYPDRLAGECIPAAARLVAIADVYDALRRMRLYKPAMSHMSAIRLMCDRSPGQFDPTLVAALSRCHVEFERIYREIAE
jgi:response regulator RpfG family c-di-GMP phosphodiesterase/tRNA A-37 threonylcarbamoyl transferase component Bud32